MSSTEHADPRFHGLETWPVEDLASALVETQLAAAAAAAQARQALAQAIEATAERLRNGGRLVYLGAGTSGRLAVLDAAELPPTFDWPDTRAIALMAGGTGALINAVEGAEDDTQAARDDLDAIALSSKDVVIGVAASGRTPYVRAGINHAQGLGALTLGITNAPEAPLVAEVDIALVAATGGEIIAGSTRMKAGTAQKILLNCLSTGVMVRLGYVWRGRMVEMRPTNAKLKSRAERMVAELTGARAEDAAQALAEHGTIKGAVVMLTLGISAQSATERLNEANGMLADVLGA